MITMMITKLVLFLMEMMMMMMMMMMVMMMMMMMMIWSGHRAQAPGSLQTGFQAAKLIGTPIDRPQGKYPNCDDNR